MIKTHISVPVCSKDLGTCPSSQKKKKKKKKKKVGGWVERKVSYGCDLIIGLLPIHLRTWPAGMELRLCYRLRVVGDVGMCLVSCDLINAERGTGWDRDAWR